MKRRINCPACDAAGKEDRYIVNGYEIKRCLSCGSLYVETLPSPDDLAAIYTSDSYYELSSDAIGRIEHENERRLSLIEGIKPVGRFLDIGCAQGLLLDRAKLAGYTTFGVEPTSKNAEIANSKGHMVFNGWLEDFTEKAGEQLFDVITCLDVIEHIDEPKMFMKLASSLLNEDGLMVISTPNYSGVIAKLLGARDPYMTPPEHINFFTSEGMKNLAKSSGLEIKSFHCFGSLIPAEMNRSIHRYIPKKMQFLAPIIRPSVNLGFRIMNYLKIGLEQEIYFQKIKQK